MPNAPLVFISSTSDLKQERLAVAGKLRPTYEPYLYEEEGAGSKSPADRCREMIEASDVFVCLLGAAYGSVYTFDVGPTSIVEWEFDTARARSETEVMAFRKEPLGIADERQVNFIKRVTTFRGGVWCKVFVTPEDLATSVGESLVKWLIEFRKGVKEAKARHRRTAQTWLRALAVAVAVSIGGIAVFWRSAFTAWSLLIAAIAVGYLIATVAVLDLGGRHVGR